MIQKNKNIFYIMGLSGSKKLTESICKHLKCKPIPTTISRFADGEIMVRPEITVRNKNITIVQSISKPVNEKIMELLIAIDSLKRASAKSINVMIPYYGYSRQDRKALGREPITSKLVAFLLEKTGATRVSIVDIHSEQTQGFFEIPVDTLRSNFILADNVYRDLTDKERKDLVVVSPDYGGIKRARNVANLLNCSLVILDKRRPNPNEAEITNILGDVKNKICLISDDMVDTAGTIVAACNILKKHGAKQIIIAATHAILSDPAISRLSEATKKGIISRIYFTNTIESVYDIKSIKNLKIIDLGKYLADVMRVYYELCGSISEIYDKYSPKKIRH